MAHEARQDPKIGKEDTAPGGPVVDPLPPSDPSNGPLDRAKLVPVLKTAASGSTPDDASPETSAPIMARVSTKATTGATSAVMVKPQRRPLLERIARVVLTLTLVSIVGFIAGAALAGSILSGLIDLETGWVKDTIKLAKELMHHLRHR